MGEEAQSPSWHMGKVNKAFYESKRQGMARAMEGDLSVNADLDAIIPEECDPLGYAMGFLDGCLGMLFELRSALSDRHIGQMRDELHGQEGYYSLLTGRYCPANFISPANWCESCRRLIRELNVATPQSAQHMDGASYVCVRWGEEVEEPAV